MKRIQRRRTKGWRMPENTVYVGRPSKWGNGYRVGDFDPDDDFTDLFPGSGAVGKAWARWQSQTRLTA